MSENKILFDLESKIKKLLGLTKDLPVSEKSPEAQVEPESIELPEPTPPETPVTVASMRPILSPDRTRPPKENE